MPAISVVMPVFNGAQFLRRAAASLFAQTFADWELLAVDDGSADESLALLDALAAADQGGPMPVSTRNRDPMKILFAHIEMPP